jgi:hypothetical protein
MATTNRELYRRKLQIDRNELDVAIQEHPGLYLEVQEASIRAASLRDEAKTEMEETYARVGTKTRTELERKEEGRVTEQRIKDAIAVNKEYTAAVSAFQEAKLEADLLNALVLAFSERGRMLSKLTDLFISGYWAQASVRGAGRDVRDKRAADAREAMASTRRPI